MSDATHPPGRRTVVMAGTDPVLATTRATTKTARAPRSAQINLTIQDTILIALAVVPQFITSHNRIKEVTQSTLRLQTILIIGPAPKEITSCTIRIVKTIDLTLAAFRNTREGQLPSSIDTEIGQATRRTITNPTSKIALTQRQVHSNHRLNSHIY